MQPFGQVPITACFATSMATVLDVAFVNAMPVAASISSDSGPPPTAMVVECTGAAAVRAEGEDLDLAFAPGSVTHTSLVAADVAHVAGGRGKLDAGEELLLIVGIDDGQRVARAVDGVDESVALVGRGDPERVRPGVASPGPRSPPTGDDASVEGSTRSRLPGAARRHQQLRQRGGEAQVVEADARRTAGQRHGGRTGVDRWSRAAARVAAAWIARIVGLLVAERLWNRPAPAARDDQSGSDEEERRAHCPHGASAGAPAQLL